MKIYEVKAYITVLAKDEHDAEDQAGRILDTVDARYVAQTSVVGDGEVYEADDDEWPEDEVAHILRYEEEVA